MNTGVVLCLTLGIVFFIFAIIFALLKEKGAILLSGFNSFSKEERENYDTKKISVDMRNSFFTWAIILFLGAILSSFINKYYAILAIALWLILFFRDVYIDPEKAFEKYKKL